MLKQFLQNQNIEFTEVNMATASAMAELYANSVYTMIAPVLQIDNIFYYNLELPGQMTNILKSHNLL